MKKVVIWVNVESSDGYGTLTWFLEENHAEKHNDALDQALCDNIYSVETFKGSDIHKQACENSEKYLGKHEYLKADDYYEARGVGTGARSNKTCEHCGKSIPKGIPHDMHHFYPEFEAYPTHKKCSTKFINSLN